MSNEYQTQATDFLRNTETTMRIKEAEVQSAPAWSKDGVSGTKYNVTLKNRRGAYTFDFWGSIHDRQNFKRPTSYDILACLDIYVGSIDDFVADFGYDETKPSEVIRTYNAVVDQSLQLQRLFTGGQLRKLQEIA